MPFPSFSVFLWIYGVTDLWIPDYVALKASPQNCKLHFTNIVLQFRPRVRRNMYEEKDIDHALNAVASEDMSAAEQACVYLEGAVRDGRHFEIIDRIRNASGATKTNSVIYMRFMRLLSSMLSFGEEEFKHCAEVGALTDVIELCTTNDVLVQMNAIELLLCLTSTYRGLEYMCAHGTLTWLVNISCGLDGEPDPLISTQALRVLGDVFSRAAVKRFDLRSRMSTDVVAHFLERILRHFEEGAEDERLAALGALADFALISTSTLEIVVTGSARLLTAWMDLLVNTKPEMVAAVLNSVALILSQSDEAYVRNSVTNEAGVTVFVAASESDGSRGRVADLKRELVNRIGATRRLVTGAYLLRLATQPVEATRHAAVNLMRAIAEQPSGWGLQMLFAVAAAPGPDNNFFAYLQERLTEYSKEGKDFKFALIEAIAHNPARCHLPDEVNAAVDKLVQQGAYFLPKMLDVTTMEG